MQRRSQRGQSLVEFALVLPILLILVLGIVDFGMGLRAYVTLTNATREGARFAAVGNPAGTYPADCTGSSSDSAVGRVCTTLSGLDLDGMQTVSVVYPDGQLPGNSVVVSADYQYEFITPLSAVAGFFSGGSFTGHLDLSATSDMRLE